MFSQLYISLQSDTVLVTSFILAYIHASLENFYYDLYDLEIYNYDVGLNNVYLHVVHNIESSINQSFI